MTMRDTAAYVVANPGETRETGDEKVPGGVLCIANELIPPNKQSRAKKLKVHKSR